MSLEKFVSDIWSNAKEELDELERLRVSLEKLKKEENLIYLVTVQSNIE